MLLLKEPDKLRYWNHWKQENCQELVKKQRIAEYKKIQQEVTDRMFGFSPLHGDYYRDYKDMV